MTYDRDNTDTYFFVDDWGMVLTKPLWEGDGEVDGVPSVGQMRDSISRTAMAYKAWQHDELLYATRACVLESYDSKGKFYKCFRHPNNRDDDMSRDHVLGLLLIEKFAGNDSILKEYVNNFRWRISKKFTFTPDLWAFMKMLGGKWWWAPVYYLLSYFIMTYNLCLNKYLQYRCKFSEELHQLNWYPQWALKNITPLQAKLRRKLFPAYVLEEFAWQLYVLKPNVFVRGLQKISLKMTSRYNYLVRLLLGDNSVRDIDVLRYRQMTSWRWGVILNETCDRHVEIIKHKDMVAANRLEEDLLKKIYYERRKS